MATLMLIKENCHFCECMLRWRSSLQGKDWDCGASWNDRDFLGKRSYPLSKIPQCYIFCFKTMFLRFFTCVTSKLIPKLFLQSSVIRFFNVFFLGVGEEPVFFKSENCN